MKYIRTLLIALAPLVFLLFVVIASQRGWFGRWDLQFIRDFIGGFGTWAILVYVLLLAINSISVIPPSAILVYSAAVLFRPLDGILAVWSGVVLGSILGFAIARFIAQDFVSRRLKGRANDFNEQLKENGFTVILMTRMVGIPPPEIVTYGAGISKISFRDYLLGTMVGSLPGAIVIVVSGDRLLNLDFRDPLAYAFPAFVLITFLLSLLYAKRKRRDKSRSPVWPEDQES